MKTSKKEFERIRAWWEKTFPPKIYCAHHPKIKLNWTNPCHPCVECDAALDRRWAGKEKP